MIHYLGISISLWMVIGALMQLRSLQLEQHRVEMAKEHPISISTVSGNLRSLTTSLINASTTILALKGCFKGMK